MENKETNNRKTCLTAKRDQKDYEELLLREILDETEPDDPDYWLRKARELADDPAHAPTPEQKAAFQRRLSEEVEKTQNQKRKDARANMRRTAAIGQIWRKVAMVIIFLTVVTATTLYCTVDSFAAGVDNFIAKVIPEFGAEELRITEKVGDGSDFDITDFEGMYVPEWLPKGYNVIEVDMQLDIKKIVYANQEDNMICYQISSHIYSLAVDDEDVVEKKTYIHDTWGKIIIKKDIIYIVWEDGNYLYTISGDKEMEDVLLEMMQKSKKIELESS